MRGKHAQYLVFISLLMMSMFVVTSSAQDCRDSTGAPIDCPATPEPQPERPPDRDGDGVFDNADRCPDQGGPAQNQGCPEDVEPSVPNPNPVDPFALLGNGVCVMATQSSSPVNVRTLPKLDADIVGVLQPGETLTVFYRVLGESLNNDEEQAEWYMTTQLGGSHYVLSEVVRLGGDCREIPLIVPADGFVDAADFNIWQNNDGDEEPDGLALEFDQLPDHILILENGETPTGRKYWRARFKFRVAVAKALDEPTVINFVIAPPDGDPPQEPFQIVMNGMPAIPPLPSQNVFVLPIDEDDPDAGFMLALPPIDPGPDPEFEPLLEIRDVPLDGFEFAADVGLTEIPEEFACDILRSEGYWWAGTEEVTGDFGLGELNEGITMPPDTEAWAWVDDSVSDFNVPSQTSVRLEREFINGNVAATSGTVGTNEFAIVASPSTHNYFPTATMIMEVVPGATGNGISEYVKVQRNICVVYK